MNAVIVYTPPFFPNLFNRMLTIASAIHFSRGFTQRHLERPRTRMLFSSLANNGSFFFSFFSFKYQYSFKYLSKYEIYVNCKNWNSIAFGLLFDDKRRYLISSILNNEYVTAKKRISLIFSSSLSIRVIPFVFDFLHSWLKNHIRSYFINDYILIWILFHRHLLKRTSFKKFTWTWIRIYLLEHDSSTTSKYIFTNIFLIMIYMLLVYMIHVIPKCIKCK